LIRFGQNQNLTSPKTFDLLRLWHHRSHEDTQMIYMPLPCIY